MHINPTSHHAQKLFQVVLIPNLGHFEVTRFTDAMSMLKRSSRCGVKEDELIDGRRRVYLDTGPGLSWPHGFHPT